VSDPGPGLFGRDPDAVNFPPFETEDLRENLTRFLESVFEEPSGAKQPIGNYRWGVYAFFDYDGEPIYVGQTSERVSTQALLSAIEAATGLAAASNLAMRLSPQALPSTPVSTVKANPVKPLRVDTVHGAKGDHSRNEPARGMKAQNDLSSFRRRRPEARSARSGCRRRQARPPRPR
jgi:hypothetical protein